MGTLIIYGASDDLIAFEGDFADEGNHYSDNPTFIHLDEGSVIKALYDERGIWRFDPVKIADGTTVKSHEKGDVEADTPDRLTLTRETEFKSFKLWNGSEGPTIAEIREYVENVFDSRGVRNLSEKQLQAVYAALSVE